MKIKINKTILFTILGVGFLLLFLIIAIPILKIDRFSIFMSFGYIYAIIFLISIILFLAGSVYYIAGRISKKEKLLIISSKLMKISEKSFISFLITMIFYVIISAELYPPIEFSKIFPEKTNYFNVIFLLFFLFFLVFLLNKRGKEWVRRIKNHFLLSVLILLMCNVKYILLEGKGFQYINYYIIGLLIGIVATNLFFRKKFLNKNIKDNIFCSPKKSIFNWIITLLGAGIFIWALANRIISEAIMIGIAGSFLGFFIVGFIQIVKYENEHGSVYRKKRKYVYF